MRKADYQPNLAIALVTNQNIITDVKGFTISPEPYKIPSDSNHWRAVVKFANRTDPTKFSEREICLNRIQRI